MLCSTMETVVPNLSGQNSALSSTGGQSVAVPACVAGHSTYIII